MTSSASNRVIVLPSSPSSFSVACNRARTRISAWLRHIGYEPLIRSSTHERLLRHERDMRAAAERDCMTFESRVNALSRQLVEERRLFNQELSDMGGRLLIADAKLHAMRKKLRATNGKKRARRK